jgi:hypothetical protein
MENKKVQLNLYILESYRDMLGKMAAERMLKNPSKSASASQIGAEIICEYLNNLERKETKNDKNSRDKEFE